MKLFDLNTVFNFGKHKGKTLKEVIEMEYGGITLDGEKIITMSESPSYLNWCAINVNYFVLSKKTIEEIKKNQYPSYFSDKALEALENKYNLWLEKKNIQHHDSDYPIYNDDYSTEERYCGACLESPCMCSDPHW
ncbi:MAG TPA: hypothetical protein VKZ97_07665 [Flavobacteriaceae bacterium]|nr:hypothetical protein [Flavobacteriaceae bacterium]